MQDATLIAASVLTVLALVSLAASWLGSAIQMWVCRAGQLVSGGLIIAGWSLFFIHGGASSQLRGLMGMAAVIIGAAALLSLSLIAARLAEPEAPEPPS